MATLICSSSISNNLFISIIFINQNHIYVGDRDFGTESILVLVRVVLTSHVWAGCDCNSPCWEQKWLKTLSAFIFYIKMIRNVFLIIFIYQVANQTALEVLAWLLSVFWVHWKSRNIDCEEVKSLSADSQWIPRLLPGLPCMSFY